MILKIACRLLGAKRSFEPMMAYCQSQFRRKTSIKFELNNVDWCKYDRQVLNHSKTQHGVENGKYIV